MPSTRNEILISDGDQLRPRNATPVSTRRLAQPPGKTDWSTYESVTFTMYLSKIGGSPTRFQMTPWLEFGIDSFGSGQNKTLTWFEAPDLKDIVGGAPATILGAYDITSPAQNQAIAAKFTINRPPKLMRINFGEPATNADGTLAAVSMDARALKFTGGTNPYLIMSLLVTMRER